MSHFHYQAGQLHAEQVPLARMVKRVWTSAETFSAGIEFANYGLRILMSYDPNGLGQKFTVDVLCGAAVLRGEVTEPKQVPAPCLVRCALTVVVTSLG